MYIPYDYIITGGLPLQVYRLLRDIAKVERLPPRVVLVTGLLAIDALKADNPQELQALFTRARDLCRS